MPRPQWWRSNAAQPYLAAAVLAGGLAAVGVIQGGTQGWALAAVMTVLAGILVGFAWLAGRGPWWER